MNKMKHIFCYVPMSNKEQFIIWKRRLEALKEKQWKKLHIYDLIQLSDHPVHAYNYFLISSFLKFGESNTYSLHILYGMLSPTLFEVVAIIGLKPTEVDFVLSLVPRNLVCIDNSKPTYNQFIATNMKEIGEISVEEHVALLTY